MNEINILNGELLKQYLIKNFNWSEKNLISFNECLVDGEVYKDVFSNEFFEGRERFITKYFNISEDEYKKKTIHELEPLIENRNNDIVLWFDFDMFCQINLLTILAYLDYSGFNGNVTVNIIKQDFYKYISIEQMIEDKVVLKSLDNFYNLYIDILVNKDFTNINSDKYKNNFNELPCLKEGVYLYSIYKTSNHEIKSFINSRVSKNRYDILVDLINELNKYGLGDSQYIKILDDMGVK